MHRHGSSFGFAMYMHRQGLLVTLRQQNVFQFPISSEARSHDSPEWPKRGTWCKSHTTRRRGHLRVAISTVSDPSGSGRVDMLTGPVASARAVVATGAWFKSKHDMYLIRGSVGAQALFLPIRRRIKKKKRKKRQGGQKV